VSGSELNWLEKVKRRNARAKEVSCDEHALSLFLLVHYEKNQTASVIC
jgi:hypothetical protein